ncbi:MAG: DNA repair protein RadA, partial [Bacteroidota bacterium]
SEKTCFAAEVGLGGELRPVNKIDQRIAEADKLGFNAIYISKFQQVQSPAGQRIKVHALGRLDEVIRAAIGARG